VSDDDKVEDVMAVFELDEGDVEELDEGELLELVDALKLELDELVDDEVLDAWRH
jgi:hypothetical protein